MSVEPGRALVTGASSGIGEAFAEVLAEQGYDLVLVARRRDRLVALAQNLSTRFGVQAEVLLADLADAAGLQKVERRLERPGDIALLVNNAGVGEIGPFAVQPRAVHAKMIAVNVSAVTMLAHAAVSSMRKAGRGSVINVASGLSFQTREGAAVYAASKAFVLHLTRGLDLELAGAGLKFQALVPGLTRTELGGAAGRAWLERTPPHRVMSAMAVARASMAGLALGELICLPRIDDVSAVEDITTRYASLGAGSDNNRIPTRYGLAER